jgi:MFS family permease
LVANFAPEDKRGRYMAVSGLAWGIPSIVGPSAAGLILDNFNPFMLWYVAARISAVAIGGFYILHRWLGKRPRFIVN